MNFPNRLSCIYLIAVFNIKITNEALDNEEYDKKNDEIDLIEKHFNININVYTHDEP